MFKHLFYAFVAVSFMGLIGCSKHPNSYIKHLNGYWEIKEVKLANGTKKQYNYNESIDYIEVNNNLKGFRKKLKPGINNTYFKTNDAENITLKIEDHKLFIHYKTPYLVWKEQIIEASEETLKLVNKNKDTYIYKRYTPMAFSVK